MLDQELVFAEAQAVTVTAISANVYDTGVERDLGAGDPLFLVVQTRAQATDAGNDATLTVTLESADNEALSTNPVVHISTGVLAFAAFSPAGTPLIVAPLPLAAYKRFLGVRFTVGAGPLTGGTFDAYVTRDVSRWRAYRSGFVIS